MNAEIISVGTELLLGQITDTNATYLSGRLAGIGIPVYHRSTVGDNRSRLLDSLKTALGRADIVITIGGLGPTEDDITKEVAAEALGAGLREDREHAAWLQQRFGAQNKPMLPLRFLTQALIPKNGAGLPNSTGTALGALFEEDNKRLIALPGPPNELVPMWMHHAEPYIRKQQTGQRQTIRSRVLRIIGIGESAVEERVRDLLPSANPTVAPYAKTGEVHLRLTARAATDDAADMLLDPLESTIRHRLGDSIYATNEQTLEETVVKLLLDQSKTVVTAESCTGGLVAERLTRVPNASQVFTEGFVTYSNLAKTKYLRVDEKLLQQHGAVSAQTACAMARGARAASGADIAVSVTGIAGPGGGTAEKPIGTVHVALAWDGGEASTASHFLGSRDDIRLRSSHTALDCVRLFLLRGPQAL